LGLGRREGFDFRGLTPPAKKLAAPLGPGEKEPAGGRRYVDTRNGRREDECITGNKVSNPLTDVRGWDRERRWIPACAGMTNGRGSGIWGRRWWWAVYTFAPSGLRRRR